MLQNSDCLIEIALKKHTKKTLGVRSKFSKTEEMRLLFTASHRIKKQPTLLLETDKKTNLIHLKCKHYYTESKTLKKGL